MLENAIDAASAIIESYLDRKIMERPFREWHDGTRQATLSLKQWPVTEMPRMAYGSANAMTVEGNESTDVQATVDVTIDRIRLSRLNSIGVETETNALFSSNLTTTLMAATIEALTGWTSSAVASVSIYLLHRMGGQNALGRQVTLTYPDQNDIEYRIRDENGLVQIVGADGSVWGDSYPRLFPEGFRSILVQYSAGYTTETLPYDIEQVCLSLASAIYKSRLRDPSMKSESLGDYSYTLSDSGGGGGILLDTSMKEALAPWRRPR